MFEDRFSLNNGQAGAATVDQQANGKAAGKPLPQPSTNGKHGAIEGDAASVAAKTAPSTNGQVGATAGDAASVAAKGSPSPNGNSSAPPQAAAATKRTANGQFAKGNRGGPGNPFARQVAAIRKELLDVVTPEVMNRVAHKLVDLSLEGDVSAIKLLLAYTIGKPAPAPEPDELAEHEWERFTNQATMFGQMPAVLAHPGPELPLTVVRTALPDITTANMNILGNYLAMPPKECKDFLDDLQSLPREQRLAKEAKLAKGPPSLIGKKPAGGGKRKS